MKVKKYILVLIAMVIFIPISVLADGVSISCDKTVVEPNATFNCTLRGNASENITGLSAKVDVGGLTLENASVDSIWMGDGQGGQYDLAAEAYPYPTNTFNIGSITLKAGSVGSATITIKNVSFINDSFDTVSISNASTSIKIEEKKVETNTNTNTNTNTGNSSSTNNNAQTNKPSSSITPSTPSTNTNSSTNTQTNNNQNTQTKSSNNYLKNLEIVGSSIVFDKKTLEYKISVLNEIEQLNIVAEAEDIKSKITINGNENLVVGENIITIVVTAEDGKTREYKLLVERKEEDIILSSNSKLSKLTIDGYKFDFKNNKYEYDLKIKDDNELNISYKTEDKNAKVEIKGNKDLKTGSVITIFVTAEDGTTSTYKINIEVLPSYTWMIVSIIEAIILVVTYSVLIIRKIISIKKQKVRIS